MKEPRLRRRKRNMIEREADRADYEAGLAKIVDPLIAAGVHVIVHRLRLEPTCGARTRAGSPCRAFALSNGRCKLHGGLSTGPRTPEGWARTRAGHRAWAVRKKGEKS